MPAVSLVTQPLRVQKRDVSSVSCPQDTQPIKLRNGQGVYLQPKLSQLFEIDVQNLQIGDRLRFKNSGVPEYNTLSLEVTASGVQLTFESQFQGEMKFLGGGHIQIEYYTATTSEPVQVPFKLEGRVRIDLTRGVLQLSNNSGDIAINLLEHAQVNQVEKVGSTSRYDAVRAIGDEEKAGLLKYVTGSPSIVTIDETYLIASNVDASSPRVLNCVLTRSQIESAITTTTPLPTTTTTSAPMIHFLPTDQGIRYKEFEALAKLMSDQARLAIQNTPEDGIVAQLNIEPVDTSRMNLGAFRFDVASGFPLCLRYDLGPDQVLNIVGDRDRALMVQWLSETTLRQKSGFTGQVLRQLPAVTIDVGNGVVSESFTVEQQAEAQHWLRAVMCFTENAIMQCGQTAADVCRQIAPVTPGVQYGVMLGSLSKPMNVVVSTGIDLANALTWHQEGPPEISTTDMPATPDIQPETQDHVFSMERPEGLDSQSLGLIIILGLGALIVVFHVLKNIYNRLARNW